LVAVPVEVEVHYIPLGEPVRLDSGEDVRCYSFSEYTRLLMLDGELWSISGELETYRDMDSRYVDLLNQKDVIIKTLQDDKTLLNAQLKRAEENWHAAEARTIAASGSTWPYYLAAGGAVVGIVGATLFLAGAR
jgi:hypothetical protein